jgi:beta-lactamase class A
MQRASWPAKMVRVTPSSSSPDSPTFNPPHLSGKISEWTALEAMIIHSDNTGTDMILKHVGADRVRDFSLTPASNELISRTALVSFWVTWRLFRIGGPPPGSRLKRS